MIIPLDSITIHQIAAGEVIERPVSIVKELVENSIDAQATHITVVLQEGGIESIQVKDNGLGISKDQLCLALSPHATSKINTFQDIYGVQSFGFRGEALASMVAVAEVEVLSKSKSAKTAHGITAFESEMSAPFLSSLIEGTHITVKRLFQNVPVRRKQLKRASTESSHILNYIQQIALIYPQIDFECVVENQLKFSSVGIADVKELLVAKVGLDKAEHLVHFQESFGDCHIEGVLSQPDISFPSRSYQWFSVNNRPCQHPLFRHVIKHVFEILMPANRHALLVLNLKVPGESIDVNIHPRKLEVAFFEAQALYKILPSVLRNVLRSSQLETDIFEVDTGNSEISVQKTDPKPGFSPFFETAILPKASFKQNNSLFEAQSQASPVATESVFHQEALKLETVPEKIEFFQLFDTYLVLILPSGMWILDQHAVHEKILYEQFKNQSKDQPIQNSLFSQIISLQAAQYECLAEHQNELESLGFNFNFLPAYQVSLEAIPSLFVGFDLEAWLIHLLDALMLGQPEAIQLPSLKERLQMKACKAAIKAGKRMQHAELKQLIMDFFKTPDRFTCPHGRPLYKKFNKAALERLFLRA